MAGEIEKYNSFLGLESEDDPMTLTHLGSGYAELKDKDGKKWRFVYGTNQWISEDIDDPDLEAPAGETYTAIEHSEFKNKQEALVYLLTLDLKKNVNTSILSANEDSEWLETYKKIKSLIDQSEIETNKEVKQNLIKQAFELYEKEG